MEFILGILFAIFGIPIIIFLCAFAYISFKAYKSGVRWNPITKEFSFNGEGLNTAKSTKNKYNKNNDKGPIIEGTVIKSEEDC